MPTKLAAKEQPLVKVFSNDYFFEIPFYQRPYAWDTDNVDELLDDLTDAMSRNGEAPYFLGSVVLIKEDDRPRSEIVDGQQRLTTLTMLLCVLRELFQDRDRAVRFNKYIRESGDEWSGAEDRFRLSLRDRDNEFFQSNVQVEGKLDDFLQSDPASFSPSQRRIFENVKHLNSVLSNRSEDDRNKLAKYVIANCFLVVVSAADEDSADRIFSVLNTRGLELSATDKLKPPILSKIPPESQEEYAKRWEGLEESLGRESFRDLFAHIRMIYRKDKLRGTLDREFREHVLRELTTERARRFVDDELEAYADVYETLSSASYQSTKGPDEVNALLRHLSRLDNFDWIPPAMAFFYKHNQRDDLFKFTRDLERLAYGLFVLRMNINQRINRYARVLRSIEGGDDLFEDKGPLQLSQDEKTEILARLNGDIYSLTRVRRPLLLRLDSLLTDPGTGHALGHYQESIISIEHVLPQSPAEDSQWMKWFPDADERERWTHRLANLVLLSRRKNTRASNYKFEKKKKEYFQRGGVTTFALTTQVVTESEWTPAVLDCRQHDLIETLKKEWRLD